MLIANGSRLGRYVILAPIGSGGMGEVYKAEDTLLGRHVALKLLPDRLALNPEAGKRFTKEAKALARRFLTPIF
jgi:eukaryotic-like serine/threonine-protein kinase